MRILRYIVTRAGLVLVAVAVLAGASIAYAITRFLGQTVDAATP